MGGDTLRLTAITQDVGNAAEELDAKYEGTELTVAFNPDYLAPASRRARGDEVTLSTLDALKPAVVRGVGDDDYLYLLMPVRVPYDGRDALALDRRVIVERLELVDFRNYADGDVRASTPGITAVVGRQRPGQDEPRRGAGLPGHARQLPRRAARGADPRRRRHGGRARHGACTTTAARCSSRPS